MGWAAWHGAPYQVLVLERRKLLPRGRPLKERDGGSVGAPELSIECGDAVATPYLPAMLLDGHPSHIMLGVTIGGNSITWRRVRGSSEQGGHMMRERLQARLDEFASPRAELSPWSASRSTSGRRCCASTARFTASSPRG